MRGQVVSSANGRQVPPDHLAVNMVGQENVATAPRDALRVSLFYRAETGCNEFGRCKNCPNQQKLVLIISRRG